MLYSILKFYVFSCVYERFNIHLFNKIVEFSHTHTHTHPYRRIENGKIIEKWNDRIDFNFRYLCLVSGWKCGGIKKNFFCLVEKKNEKIENKIYINLLICPY